MTEGRTIDRAAQRREVDANYDVFTRSLSTILPDHIGQFALIKSRKIVAYFDTPAEASRAALTRFGEFAFSIQEVTKEPIDLGFFRMVHLECSSR